MRKNDRKMIANMFSVLSETVILLLYEDDEEKEKEMIYILNQLRDLVKEIDAWVEEE